MDVSVFLTELEELEDIPDPGRKIRVAYHDACHLSNGQGVRSEPRSLLRRVPGLEVVELRDAHLCCGSAGTYNIDQPEIAASLGDGKAKAIVDSDAELVASGNIGCLTQIRMHLERQGAPIRIRHTAQILRDAWRGDL